MNNRFIVTMYETLESSKQARLKAELRSIVYWQYTTCVRQHVLVWTYESPHCVKYRQWVHLHLLPLRSTNEAINFNYSVSRGAPAVTAIHPSCPARVIARQRASTQFSETYLHRGRRCRGSERDETVYSMNFLALLLQALRLRNYPEDSLLYNQKI